MLAPARAEPASVTEVTSARQVAEGQRIYLSGILPSGRPLSGRQGDQLLVGADAACVNCHRRSGLGTVEGQLQIPPISSHFLFDPATAKPLVNMDPRVSKRFNQSHEPYSDSELATVIQQGVNNRGRSLSLVMPRFALDQAEQAALGAYLHQLSAQWSPGVSPDQIQLATVITPDVDPAQRAALIATLQAIVHQKNGSTVVASKRGGARRHMTSAAELVLGTERTWALNIWSLQGPAESWPAQLEALYQQQPVFALVSGLSASTWQPMHAFCSHNAIPCWFPSLDLPASDPSPDALFFSGGVRLEAAVFAKFIAAGPAPCQVVQLFNPDVVGRAAALALSQALSGSPCSLQDRVLPNNPAPQDLRAAFANLPPHASIMAWLNPAQLAALQVVTPPQAVCFFSGQLLHAQLEALPAPWRPSARFIYPFELPAQRAVNLTYFSAWRQLNHLPLVDELLQSQAFFAMNFLSDTISEMLDNLFRDYLVERAQTMLSKREGSKAEQESRDRFALGKTGDLAKKHGAPNALVRTPLADSPDMAPPQHGTTFYPHLSLAPGQLFASKGAFVVSFGNCQASCRLE
jgi:hypothetical protein